MERFKIHPNDYLKNSIDGWYNSAYHGGTSHISGRIENIICTLKNDIIIREPEDPLLTNAVNRLHDILIDDFKHIKDQIGSTFTVVVVPRAKVNYSPHQLLLKETIRKVTIALGLEDGTGYINRTQNTRTTHRNRAGFGGDGPLPYIGITNDTCSISTDVNGKTILLIDDIYTPSINIDEDAIQALLDHGAFRVYFYAIGHTV